MDEETSIDRETIRASLSQMSFEDLQKLKSEIGTKVYDTILGVESKKRKPVNTDFKRANKNRPREMSSKRPISLKDLISVKKNVPRDPRFDPLCGTFDPKHFNKSYKFINDVKRKERIALKKELQETADEKRKKQIKYLIQRMDNQLRESVKKDKEDEIIDEEKKAIKDKLKKGEKPEYQKKSEKKIMNLLHKYEELKKSKKLKKHIEKRSKKVARKDFKKMDEINE